MSKTYLIRGWTVSAVGLLLTSIVHCVWQARTLANDCDESQEAATLEKYIKQLNAPSPESKINAALLLAKLGPDARSATKALLNNLSHENPSVRAVCADALGSIGAFAKEALPALVFLLKDSETMVRSSASSALGQMRLQSPEVTKALNDALGDSELPVRVRSAIALTKITPNDISKPISTLIQCAAAKNLDVQCMAIGGLANLGERALPGLGNAMTSKNVREREGASYAIVAMCYEKSFGDTSVIDLLGRASKDESAVVRQNAATALALIHSKSKSDFR